MLLAVKKTNFSAKSDKWHCDLLKTDRRLLQKDKSIENRSIDNKIKKITSLINSKMCRTKLWIVKAFLIYSEDFFILY